MTSVWRAKPGRLGSHAIGGPGEVGGRTKCERMELRFRGSSSRRPQRKGGEDGHDGDKDSALAELKLGPEYRGPEGPRLRLLSASEPGPRPRAYEMRADGGDDSSGREADRGRELRRRAGDRRGGTAGTGRDGDTKQKGRCIAPALRVSTADLKVRGYVCLDYLPSRNGLRRRERLG